MIVNIELYPLQVFCRTMDLGTFSAAAQAMRISQPTVSQQVARLEAALKTRLFQRVGHKVVPTPDAERLWAFARGLLAKVSEFEEELASGRASVRGMVRYGMPESCQWTPHYRRIMQQIAEFPDLEFDVAIEPAKAVAERLVRGDLDFGFIVGERLSQDLRYERFGEEEYCLVSAHKEFFSALQGRSGQAARWIRFPGSDLFFAPWARANHYKPKPSRDRVVLQIGTLAGAIHAIEEGAGMAVVPRQCAAQGLKAKRLREYAGAPAKNTIYLARRVGETLPRRVELVMELLKKAKREIG